MDMRNLQRGQSRKQWKQQEPRKGKKKKKKHRNKLDRDAVCRVFGVSGVTFTWLRVKMGWTLLAGFMVSHRDPTEKSSVVWGTGQTADLRGI